MHANNGTWMVEFVNGVKLAITPDLMQAFGKAPGEYTVSRGDTYDVKRVYMQPSKTRRTRASKTTSYIHTLCCTHASVDMHNIRYWRSNMRSHIDMLKGGCPAIISSIHNHINIRSQYHIQPFDRAWDCEYVDALKSTRMISK